VSTFVLVHGAWHGGWCWERLVAQLGERGHRSVVMDLPVDDGTATFDDYAAVVLDAAAGVGEDMVLVGHSMGAMVIPLVAQQAPASALVFLCHVVPKFGGMPWEDGPPMDRPGTMDAAVRGEDDSMTWTSLEGGPRRSTKTARPRMLRGHTPGCGSRTPRPCGGSRIRSANGPAGGASL
jgi:pimeloyl-ACP methyl ester carboxylesterase